MPDDFLLFRSSRIHYSCWGSGERIVFAFHGYGESAVSFALLEEPLGKDFTVVAVDLPFHGRTEWNEGLSFAPADLLLILEQLTARLPGRSPGWWLLGYSMGGRVALHLLELAPEKVGKLILLAPDGLKMNAWYWLATQTSAGNRLFRYTMDHPGWFFSLLRLGNSLKLVNPGIFKFTIRYIDDIQVRHNLYDRWTAMRGFRPRLSVIREIIRSKDLPVRLLYGRYDRIIRWETGERFCRGLESQCRLLLLSSGHQLLAAGNSETILKAITS